MMTGMVASTWLHKADQFAVAQVDVRQKAEVRARALTTPYTMYRIIFATLCCVETELLSDSAFKIAGTWQDTHTHTHTRKTHHDS
jgi:hypothetical protein